MQLRREKKRGMSERETRNDLLILWMIFAVKDSHLPTLPLFLSPSGRNCIEKAEGGIDYPI